MRVYLFIVRGWGGGGWGDRGGESNFVKVVGFGRSAAGGESAPPAAAEARLRKFGFLNPPPHVRLSSPRSPFAEQQFHLEKLFAAEPEQGLLLIPLPRLWMGSPRPSRLRTGAARSPLLKLLGRWASGLNGSPFSSRWLIETRLLGSKPVKILAAGGKVLSRPAAPQLRETFQHPLEHDALVRADADFQDSCWLLCLQTLQNKPNKQTKPL